MKCGIPLVLGVVFLSQTSALPAPSEASIAASHQDEAHPVLARELRDLIRSLEDQLGIAAGATSGMDVASILNLLAARDDDLLFRRHPKTAADLEAVAV